VSVATDLLKHGKAVVIDNTNADRDVRKVWISLASKFGIPIRCFHFTASKELAKHNNLVRALSGSLVVSSLLEPPTL
jgi:bifunctional polynucleotide phosphatase/kinase